MVWAGLRITVALQPQTRELVWRSTHSEAVAPSSCLHVPNQHLTSPALWNPSYHIEEFAQAAENFNPFFHVINCESLASGPHGQPFF